MTIEQYSEMMQRFNDSLELMSRQIGSSFSCYSNPQHLQTMYDIMQDRFQSFGTDIGSQFAVTLQSQLQNISIPTNDSFMEIGNTLAKAFNSAGYGSTLNELFSSNMSQSLSVFAEQLSSIAIHPGYVDFPESLIPEDFEYEEVETENNNNVIATPSVNEASAPINASANSVKKVSVNSAIMLICTLIQTLLAILVFCQPNQQERIANAMEESNHIDAQGNELLQKYLETQGTNNLNPEQVESLNSNITHLNAILLQLEPCLADILELQDRSSCDYSESPQFQSDSLKADNTDMP